MRILYRQIPLYLALLCCGFCLTNTSAEFSNAQGIDPGEVVPDDDKPQESIESLQRKAGQLRQEEKWTEAADVYRQLVERDPESGVDWHLLGFSLHGTGDLDKAIAAHKTATKFDNFKSISLFNLGCAYSLKNDPDKSLDYLRQAIDADFQRIELLESDSDLENIRKDPRFKGLLAYANGEEPKNDKPQADANPLVGNWKMLSGKKAGTDVSGTDMPPQISVSEKVFTLPSPEVDGEPFVMSYVVDKSTTPFSIDFKIESGPIPQGEALGIFKLEGDKMTLCYDPTAQNRPEKFETNEENGCLLFVMNKQSKTAGKTDKLVGKWKFLSGVRAGSKIEEERLKINIDINKKTITIPVGPDEKFVISYEIDGTHSPLNIDMKIESGPAPENSKAIGIIKIGDGEFAICYDPGGEKRPDKFESTEENGCFYFKLKKLEED